MATSNRQVKLYDLAVVLASANALSDGDTIFRRNLYAACNMRSKELRVTAKDRATIRQFLGELR